MLEKLTIIVLGLTFILAGFLSLTGELNNLPTVNIFGFSLGALLMAIASTIDDPMSEFKDKRVTISVIFKAIFYTLSLMSIVLIPLLGNRNSFVRYLMENINNDVFLLFSIGLSFLTFAISDFYKKQLIRKFNLEKLNAISETKHTIAKEIRKAIEKDKL